MIYLAKFFKFAYQYSRYNTRPVWRFLGEALLSPDRLRGTPKGSLLIRAKTTVNESSSSLHPDQVHVYHCIRVSSESDETLRKLFLIGIDLNNLYVCSGKSSQLLLKLDNVNSTTVNILLNGVAAGVLESLASPDGYLQTNRHHRTMKDKDWKHHHHHHHHSHHPNPQYYHYGPGLGGFPTVGNGAGFAGPMTATSSFSGGFGFDPNSPTGIAGGFSGSMATASGFGAPAIEQFGG